MNRQVVYGVWLRKVLITLVVMVQLFSAGSVAALTTEDRQRLYTPFFDPSISQNGCSTGTTLPGNTNEEKVWNYLISKGMTVVQAAGSMGNLRHEGNFNPKQVEYGHMSGDRWINGQPFDFPPEMDTIPPSDLAPIASGKYAGQPGYGIVQWTSPGRKQGLQAMADEKGLPVHDLGLQLDFMWSELESDYYRTRALEPLLATDDLAEAVRIWQEEYEVGRGFEPRMEAALEMLTLFGSGTSSVGSTPATTPVSGCYSASLEGVVCPANMEPHPSRTGYYRMPDAPNGEYSLYGVPERRFGSQQLVCVIYSVALAFNDAMQGRSKLRVGDLNASGHNSHNKGVAVDLSGEGELQVASHIRSWKGTYDKEATILLGKLFADTGVLRNIWWCDPGDDSTEQIIDYAQTKGLEGEIKCIEGHSDHFHVDIKAEYRLDFWEP